MTDIMSGNRIRNDGMTERGNTICPSHFMAGGIKIQTAYCISLRIELFNFVSLLKYKRQMTGNKLCKPAQRSGAGLRIICYPSSDVYYFNKLTKLNIQFL